MERQSPQRRRRRLTPQQRRKLRRKRWLKKNLKFIIAAVIVVAVVIILSATVFKPRGNDVTVASSNAQPAAENSAETSENTETAVQETAEQTDTDAVSENVPEATALTTSSDTATVQYSDQSFVFDDAYVAAIKGETTGPSFQLDMSRVDEAYRDRYPETSDSWLPLLVKANNVSEKTICITVDDCFQASNMKQIIQCALDNNSKLTFFPIGENMEKEAIASAVKWAWESGMEIENHTYTHIGLFHYDDETMRTEIWKQNRRLEQVLGVNYTEHFFRPHGGDERNCQRVHAYCYQLGFYGIAYWTESGSAVNSASDLQNLENNLAPGNIYLFHTTDKDLQTLLTFIPYCVQQGYKLITMNEMFGLPENETSPLTTTMDDPAPELSAFKVVPVQLKKTTRCRAAAVVQQRLIDLGWLEDSADGEFADNSRLATGFFQLASGIDADGVATIETQQAMFADNAEKGSQERIEELKASYKK